jgi:hypothetical protein
MLLGAFQPPSLHRYNLQGASLRMTILREFHEEHPKQVHPIGRTQTLPKEVVGKQGPEPAISTL